MWRICLIVALLGVSAAQETCTYDYECRNNPYRLCKSLDSECTYTIPGFAVTNHSVYYAQSCTAQGTLVWSFKRVSTEGGAPEEVYSRTQVNADVNPSRIVGVADGHLFFEILSRQPGLAIKSIDLANLSKVEGDVTTGAWTLSISDFDLQSNAPATYLCNSRPAPNKTIERYPIFPAEGLVESQGVIYTMNALNGCGVLRRDSEVDLYFTTYTTNSTDGKITTNFHRGTTTCIRCPLPAPFHSTLGRVYALDVAGDYVYYGMDSGLYRVRKSGGGVTQIMTGEKASAVEILSSRIVYNSGYAIKSIGFEGGSAVLLSTTPQTGRCACRSGFEGALCETCTGQVQWEPSTHLPVCVSVVSGVPTSCYEDYHCGNIPYTTCTRGVGGGVGGTCACVSANFTGARCDVCESPRRVSWTDSGRPVCA